VGQIIDTSGVLDTYVALDIEATGISPNKSRIIEIGAIKVREGVVIDYFSSLINPCLPLSEEITQLTGITKAMVESAPNAREVLARFLDFIEDYIWLGHSINSDYGYIKNELLRNDMLEKGLEKYGYDTLTLARKLLPDVSSKSLANLCRYYSIENECEHRAIWDAKATIELFYKLQSQFYNDKKESFKKILLTHKVKKLQKITNWQKNYLNDLLKYHKINFSGRLDELTMSEASKIIDKIILTKGRII
jgi:DNA polymerase-3 subunit alpha (Gram-positive type)